MMERPSGYYWAFIFDNWVVVQHSEGYTYGIGTPCELGTPEDPVPDTKFGPRLEPPPPTSDYDKRWLDSNQTTFFQDSGYPGIALDQNFAFWFCDGTGSETWGPYDTLEQAQYALKQYAESI